MAEYVNQFGRKPGRGVRPWLLMPKVLGAAVYFGSIMAGLIVAVMLRPASVRGVRADPAEWMPWIDMLHTIVVFSAVPGLLLAIACGLGLLWLHGKVMLRMRWLRLKLAVLAVGIPLLHWSASSLLALVRSDVEAGADGGAVKAHAQLFELTLLGAVLMGATVIILGRHKPRLGQPVATVAQQRAAQEGKA